MAEKKEERKIPFIGDTVEVSECRKYGLRRNKICGIVIWRPINKSRGTPQLYAIWIPDGLQENEQQAQAAMLKTMHDTIFNSYEHNHWEHYVSYTWRMIMENGDKQHILYVPVEYKSNIKFLDAEEEGLVVGDLVLDRRWCMRFGKHPIRVVLAIKYDQYYGMNRICVENPLEERHLRFGNWVYPVLRKDLICISRRKLPKIIEKEVPVKKSVFSEILSRSA